MKKVIFNFSKVLFFASLIFISASCDKDDENINPNATVPDPEGTIIVSVRNNNNGSTSVPIYDGSFAIDNGDNFGGDYGDWYFSTVGKVNGLGNITKIPDSGWSRKCSAIEGHGYVGVCCRGNRITFVRIYVDSYIIAAGTNGVIGANVKYQYPFNGKETKIELVPKSISFDEFNYVYSSNSYYYSGKDIYVKNKVSCEMKLEASWYNGSFSFDGYNINVSNIWILKSNADNIINNSKIATIYSSGLPSEILTINKP